jgi:hypothetical protein
VIIGVLYLAKNMGWLTIDFNFNLWQLWPLLIVFWGLSLLTGKNVASIFAGIILTLTVLTITFILVFGQNEYAINVKTAMQSNTDKTADRTIEYKNIRQVLPISVDQDTKAKTAEFIIKSNFSETFIGGNSTGLANGKLETNFTALTVNSKMSGNKQTVNIETKPKVFNFNPRTSLLNIQLNNELTSAVYLESIASTVNFSFADLATHLVSIDSTASSLNLNLEGAQAQTIEIAGKASEINLILPQTTAVRIELKKAMDISSEKLEKIDEKTYQTVGYKENQDKLTIDLDLTGSNLGIQ